MEQLRKQGKKILVVHEQGRWSAIFQRILAADRILFAATGWQALQTASIHPLDIIFYHLHTPDLDAFAFCQQIQDVPGAQALPVVVFGTMADDQVQPRLQQAGAAGYLRQPFRPEEVQRARHCALNGERYFPPPQRDSRPDTGYRKRLGEWGERVAARYLEGEGYQIVDRNWRTRRGEIDLVAQAGEILVFVEVKTRRGRSRGAPEAGLTAAKANKILELAHSYLYEKELGEIAWRVDLVAVELDRQGELLRCEHIQNAVLGW